MMSSWARQAACLSSTPAAVFLTASPSASGPYLAASRQTPGRSRLPPVSSMYVTASSRTGSSSRPTVAGARSASRSSCTAGVATVCPGAGVVMSPLGRRVDRGRGCLPVDWPAVRRREAEPVHPHAPVARSVVFDEQDALPLAEHHARAVDRNHQRRNAEERVLEVRVAIRELAVLRAQVLEANAHVVVAVAPVRRHQLVGRHVKVVAESALALVEEEARGGVQAEQYHHPGVDAARGDEALDLVGDVLEPARLARPDV